jgi:hypothetical protein
LSERNLLNLARPLPKLLLADTPLAGYSRGALLAWSPDDSEILLTMNKQGYYLFETSNLPVRETTATASALPTQKTWQETETKSRRLLIEKAKLPEALAETALQAETLFSPNGLRFLYQKISGAKKEYRVYDLSDPLPVGGQRDYLTLTTDASHDLKVSWYSDNRHLLLFSCLPAQAGQPRLDKNNNESGKEGNCREGTVEIIEIDGDNRTQIYRGAVAAGDVFPSPDGGELLVLTSFNPEAEPNLYAISLR